MACYSSSGRCAVIFISDGRTITRNRFSSYIFNGLRTEGEKLQRERGIEMICFNEDTVRRGVPLTAEIEKTIQNSWIALVIASDAYATVDCLNQLLWILKRKAEQQDAYLVLPIFYHIGTDEVQFQTDNFAKAFVHLTLKYGEPKAKEWRLGLAELVKLGGHVVTPNKPEALIVTTIVGNVRNHVEWLCAKRIIQATLYEKSLGVAACLAETTKKYGESVSRWNGSPSNTGCVRISVEEDEAQPEKKCDGIIVGRSQSCFAAEEECVRRPAFMALLEKLVGGDSSSRGIDSDRFESVTHSSEQRISKRSVQEALLALKSLFSEDPEIVSQKLGDCKGSFQILKSLTEKDGLNTMGMMMLPNLEQESAAVIQKRLSGAQGRKEVDLKIHKQHQLSVEVEELLEEYNKVEKTMNSNSDKARQLESQISRLQAQLVVVQGKHEEDTRCFHDLTAELKSRYEELKNLKNANLVKQKSDIEEFEKHACKEWEMIENVIDEAIPKFCTTNS
ncbi:uncharacterized protein LOC126673078 [Mercurialis annua]|uniref:uncharacterized protein LOC126673078 n=1 Tax=Mercurialis annua TaxID=3986 RepID=UPI0021610716|nr:uncharacterized protein LOC126673078 [Mercurialis annua]